MRNSPVNKKTAGVLIITFVRAFMCAIARRKFFKHVLILDYGITTMNLNLLLV